MLKQPDLVSVRFPIWVINNAHIRAILLYLKFPQDMDNERRSVITPLSESQ